jgi:hypothetical protein
MSSSEQNQTQMCFGPFRSSSVHSHNLIHQPVYGFICLGHQQCIITIKINI